MRTLVTIFLDALLPASQHARLVAEASEEDIRALYRPTEVDGVVALAHFRAPLMRALIHEAKFRANERAFTLLSELLRVHIQEGAVVPVPLAKKRQRERGYNQVVEVAKRARLQIEQVLMKVRETPPQTSLSRTARKQNLEGVFAVRTHTLPLDTPLILLDDVITTGTTLTEAARALKMAGFTDVRCVALAH